MNTIIKKSNANAIKDFAQFGNRKIIQGRKLEALYNLIQKKGKPMKTKDEKLKNVKVLEYKEGEYIGIIRKEFNTDKFFPCKLSIVLLTKL